MKKGQESASKECQKCAERATKTFCDAGVQTEKRATKTFCDAGVQTENAQEQPIEEDMEEEQEEPRQPSRLSDEERTARLLNSLNFLLHL